MGLVGMVTDFCCALVLISWTIKTYPRITSCSLSVLDLQQVYLSSLQESTLQDKNRQQPDEKLKRASPGVLQLG